MNQIILKYYRVFSHKLWFKPLLFCLFSVAAALFARLADGFGFSELVPDIKADSIEGLLDTIANTMLVISIFAVGSMVSAFTSASNNATPRSFKIIVTDDVSLNALAVFIGAFIFSIVATIALNNGYYGKTGRFVLFVVTILFFTVVILTFLHWVDKISRLGRLENTISQVENVATQSLEAYIQHPTLKAMPIIGEFPNGQSILAQDIGYVQKIDLDALQKIAVEHELKIRINCLPGAFVNKHSTIAWIQSSQNPLSAPITQKIAETLQIGSTRLYNHDPRFGLIALSEIASRALSPGINDPGTAIQIVGCHERLFFLWNKSNKNSHIEKTVYDRIEVPKIAMDDFFEDAFRPIARDGAGTIELMLRLQKTFTALHTINQTDIKEAAMRNSAEALQRAQIALDFEKDIETLKQHCLFNE
ncbi:hypothetical protein FFWV33_10230 [Flavobacterium faecale]|uniref:DUF2254 domain-containing protein n=1 Tax=Flavobacterium faecale TaxID=1355330 RepID=A0A2S1LDT5_9FLAO|nr:DUF2254 domain-containing protein [Flavobacterium faecale]AWG21878.1 hypothetical protein FFWV33_10230 [Flavobacterium faecale]